MQRPWIRLFNWFVVLGLLFSVRPASAVIPAAFPLKGVLKGQQYILVAKVEKVHPDKPAMMLKVDEILKGKPPFEKLPINLTGMPRPRRTTSRPSSSSAWPRACRL